MGGQDKQGFAMRQGVMTNLRVRLLMAPGDPCMLGHGRRKGERRRKSVRGCIISPDLSVLNLVIVKQGMLLCQLIHEAAMTASLGVFPLHSDYNHPVLISPLGSLPLCTSKL